MTTPIIRRYHSSVNVLKPSSDEMSIQPPSSLFSLRSNNHSLSPTSSVVISSPSSFISSISISSPQQKQRLSPISASATSPLLRHHSSPALLPGSSKLTKTLSFCIPSSSGNSKLKSASLELDSFSSYPLVDEVSNDSHSKFDALWNPPLHSNNDDDGIPTYNFQYLPWFTTLLDECHITVPHIRTFITDYCNLYFGTLHFDILMLSSYFDIQSNHLITKEDTDSDYEIPIPSFTVLYFVGCILFYVLNFEKEYFIQPGKWKHFMSKAEQHYHPTVPFHNASHAANVVYSMFCLLYTRKAVSALNHTTTVPLYNLQCMFSLPPIYRFSIIVACIIHDVGHFGLSNQFLKSVHHKFVSLYLPCKSTLEAMHADIGIQLLEENHESSIFSSYPPNLQMKIYSTIQELVLATDLAEAKKVLQSISDNKDLNKYILHPNLSSYIRLTPTNNSDTILYKEKSKDENSIPESKEKYYFLTMKLLIKICDLGHCGLEFDTHIQWAERMSIEYENEQILRRILKLATNSTKCKCKCKTRKQKIRKAKMAYQHLSNGLSLTPCSNTRSPKIPKTVESGQIKYIKKRRGFEESDTDIEQQSGIRNKKEKQNLFESSLDYLKVPQSFAFRKAISGGLLSSPLTARILSPIVSQYPRKLSIHSPQQHYTRTERFFCSCSCQMQRSFMRQHVLPLVSLLQEITSNKHENANEMLQQLLLNLQCWEHEEYCLLQYKDEKLKIKP